MRLILSTLVVVGIALSQMFPFPGPGLPGSGGGGSDPDGAGVTKYFGPGCGTAGAPTAGGNGSNSACTTTGTNQSITGYGMAAQVTTGGHTAGYSVVSIAAYLNPPINSASSFQAAIYSAGATGTLLCSGNLSNPGTTTPGWIEDTFTGCSTTLTANTVYTISVTTGGLNTVVYNASAGQIGYKSGASLGSWPSSITWSTGYIYDLYLKVTTN